MLASIQLDPEKPMRSLGWCLAVRTACKATACPSADHAERAAADARHGLRGVGGRRQDLERQRRRLRQLDVRLLACFVLGGRLAERRPWPRPACCLPSSWTDSSVSPEPLASEAVVVSRGASVSVDVVAEASNPPEASPSASASCDQAGADTQEAAHEDGASDEGGSRRRGGRHGGAGDAEEASTEFESRTFFMEQLRV